MVVRFGFVVPNIFLLLCLSAGGQAPAGERPVLADETVDRFAGASALVVEGARTYPAPDIVRALALCPRFIIVSHPRAPLADFIRYIEENVRLGYLRGGFPDAAVKAVADREKGVLRVTTEEGRRVVAGPVIVEGSKALPVEEIIRVVTETDPERKYESRWEPGEPARLDPPFLETMRDAVERAYARAGHLSAEIGVSVPAAEADRASLVVRVLEEGSPSTLGEVSFEGTFKDDVETLTRTVGIRPGMPLDRAALDGFEARLDGLGRYFHVDIEAVPSGSSGRTDLRIKLLQADFAPPLGEPEPEERAVLRKAFRWFGDTSRWKGPLVFRADATGVIERLGLGSWLERAVFEAGVAPDGLLIEARYRRRASDTDERVGLVVAGNRGMLVAAPLRLVSRFDPSRGPTLLAHLKLLPAEQAKIAAGDDPMRLMAGLSFGKGQRDDPRFQLDLEAPEVALAHLSQSEFLEYRFDGDRVHIEHAAKRERVKVASVDRETGAVDLHARAEENGLALSVSFEGPALASRLEAMDGEARRLGYREVSPVRFLGLSGIGVLKLARFVSGKRDAAQVRCLEAVVTGLLDRESQVSEYLAGLFADGASVKESGRERFHVPLSETREGLGAFLGFVASRLAADMPRDSWLQTLFREAACIGSGESLYTAVELKRLFGSSEAGPIGCWALAEALAALGRSAQAGMFADLALRQASVAGFRTELAVLRREGTLPARIIAALGKSLRALDEAAVASVGADVERLGDDDEREFVRLFDAARRIEDPMEAGASLLEAFWVTGLDDLIRSRSRALVP
jgi:hypothetical protein